MRKFTKLTRDRIRALPAGLKISEHGVVAAKLADGDVRWYVNVMVDGQRIHRLIGKESDKVSRSDAEAFIEQARTDARHDRLNLPKGRKVALTVAAACDLYLAAMDETGGKNMKSKREHIARQIKPFMGTMPLRKVSEFTLQKLRKHMLDRDYAMATTNAVAMTWSHMCKWLMRNKKADWLIPMMGTRTANNVRKVIIPDDKIPALIAAADADLSPQTAAFVRIGLGTALRHAEICRIRGRDIDWSRNRIFVTVKGGDPHEAVIPKTLADWLREYVKTLPDPEGWLFPTTRTRTGHSDRMNTQFKRVCKAAGLDVEGDRKVTPHTMRHTATTAFAAKVHGDPAKIKMFTGHKSDAMVQRYTHPSDQQIDEAVEAVAADQITHRLHTDDGSRPRLTALND